MARPIFLEAAPEAPEIHRSSPFEHVQTAETVAVVTTLSKPISSAGPWVTKVGTIVVKPSLPQWMTSPSGPQRTSR